MKVSTSRTFLAIICAAGLMFLGLIIPLAPGDSPVKAQDERASLAGKNFSPAQPEARVESSPGQAVLVADPNSAAGPAQIVTELFVDDGSAEAAVGITGGGTLWGVNRLTPASYPMTLTHVSILFQGQQGLPRGSPITVLVGTNPSGGANINNVTFSQQINAVVEAVDNFYLYQVTPVTINSGDFVVGFRAMHGADVLPLAVDRTAPQRRRSYVSQNGTTFTILDDANPSVAGNLMIRARVQGQPPGCPTVSGVNPPGGAVGSQVTITGSNFTGVTSVRFAGGVAAQFTINSNTQITATVPQGAVTGPITISKPNCTDAQTAPFAVSTSSPTELAVDDGTFETTFGLSGGGTSWRVNRLTPTSYPATMNAVSIFFRSNSSLAVGSPLTVVYGANPGGGTFINGIQLQTMDSSVQAIGQFNVYNVSPLTINSGDFVVGYKITHGASVFPYALDTTPPSQRRSYRSLDGVAFNIIDDIPQTTAGNYGIRARLQTQTQNCPTASAVNPASGGAGSQVTITGSNFTGVNAVRFAGGVNATFTVNSDTQITTTVPQGAVTGPITISKPNCPDATTAVFTVPGGCAYSINPTSQSFPGSGGSGSVAVTTQAGCAWTAASNASFITITSGSSGNGSGAVNYTLAANSGAARTGTITIAGQTFTVTQAAGSSCTYSINPTNQSFPSSGGSGSVNVTTQGGCAWTAASNASWITITSGASGTGFGTVNYTVGADSAASFRSGALTIAGRIFTVQQGAPPPGVWTAQTSGTTNELRAAHFLSESEGWAAGANATLLRTTNGGGSWSAVNTGVDAGRGFNSVHFLDHNAGWAGGTSAVARTLNGGANWAAATLPATVIVAENVSYNSFSFLSSTSFWTGGGGFAFGDQASFLSIHGMDASGNLRRDGSIITTPSAAFLDIHFPPEGGGWMVGGNGRIQIYDPNAPGGTRSQSSGTQEQLNAIQMKLVGNNWNGWVVGNNGVILKTTNGGGAWTRQTSSVTANLRDVFFVDANRGWAVGDGGLILASNDGGAAWTREQSGVTANLRGVFFVNATTGFAVGDNGAILRRGVSTVGSLASVSAASFLGAELAVESIVAAFGQNLATTTQVAPGVPLPTDLAGTTVKVRDSAGVTRLAGVLNVASVERPAGLFFVAPTQVNYQIPPGTAAGAATVTITSGASAVSTGTVNIANVAPGLFTANASGQGVAAAVVFRRRADGSESFEPVSRFDQAQGRFVAAPIDLGPETDQVFLILYGAGFRFRSSLAATAVAIGGVNSEVLFAGDAPGFVGLDQANVRLSRSLIGRGEVDVVLRVDGKTANNVRIAIN